MSEKYIVFVPKNWEWSASEDQAKKVLDELIGAGIVQGDPADPDNLKNGPQYETLFKDPDPKPDPSGNGNGCDPGNMTVELHNGKLRGYAGDNLTPVACIHCDAELPYEEAQDSFWALKDGEGADSPRMQMECYHCGASTPAMGADFGRSGAFSNFGVLFRGETSNRLEVEDAGERQLSDWVGTEMTWVQIHGW